MKSYTFKVKHLNTGTEQFETILAIHMPLEAFFESVKQTPYLKSFAEKNPQSIITCSDYYFYPDNSKYPQYLSDDLYYCKLSTLISASSLKSFLIDNDVVATLPEYPTVSDAEFSDPADFLFNDVCEVVNNEQVNSI